MVDGYAIDEGNRKVDIFQKFMNSDNVFLLFLYPDGSDKSVAIPLDQFKEQYAAL